jgi:Cupin superfamily protein
VDSFLNEIWAETHYHVKRNCVDYFDNLLHGPSAVEDLLELFRREPSMVRLIREHDKKSPDNYRLADGSLDVARVRSDFADGYTIVLDDVEQYVRSIASLAHAIEVELNFATKVNAYVTPPESQGFVAHYDGHDVLILQIQGSKIWHLYEGADVPPHQLRREEKWIAADILSSPIDLRLEVGDVLYVPRGRVHAAEATSEPSVHLTVGVHAPTALTFAVAALNALSFFDDRLSVRLPPRHLDDADARATLGVLLRDAVRTVEDPRAVAGGLEALADILVRRGQGPPLGPVSDAFAIDGQTVVRKYQPLYSRVIAINGGVTLQFAQLSIPARSDHKAAMLFVSGSTEPFRVCDLPGLRPAQQTELARTLIVSGFLVRCPTTDVNDRLG